MSRDGLLKLLDRYYYLAPAWLLLEQFLWPGFRAGAVVGQGFLPQAAFYGVEAAIGAAFWYKLPAARPAALVQNVACLVFYFKFILYSPVDAAIGAIDGGGDIALFAKDYAAAVPGALNAAAQVVLRIQAQLYGGKES